MSRHSIWAAGAALALSLAVAAPRAASAQTTITLTGVVRDFSDTHPDFEKTMGDDRGIVETTLGLDGNPVYASSTTTATTHGKEYFDQWYNDVSGVNMSALLPITLNETSPGSGIYQYSNSAFFPIDDQLLGNEGRAHNYHFTYALHSAFTYVGGETFSFTGDDDLWVFVNDQLVVDLGGVHPAESSTISLDTLASSLGLTTGNIYSFDLFFAERHTSESNFNIQTSIVLTPTSPDVPEPGTLAFCGAGLAGGLALLLRRRR